MINIQNLTKKFGETTIFNNLNLKIPDGKIITIIGPSGSGKSTLLNMIALLDRDFSGEISINDTNLSEIKDTGDATLYRGKNISFIFQNFHLIDSLTVGENIDLIIEMNKSERNYQTSKILELVGLADKINSYPPSLSGGEKQRVAIARSFVGKSQLLLADEPTGSLDKKNSINICNLITQLNSETKNTIILITHDPEVAKIGDKTYELTDYQLIEKHDKTL